MKTHSFAGAEGNLLAASIYDVDDKDAPTALLLHGGGQTRHSWHGASRLLQRHGIRAVAVDARGHGDSDWSASGHYRFEHFAEDLIALAAQATEMTGARPVSIGASMGGITTMKTFATRADLFAATVFVDITPTMTESGVMRIMEFMGAKAAEGFATVDEAADAVAAYMPHRKRPKTTSGLEKNLRQREDGRWYWHWDPAFATGAHSIVSDGQAQMETVRRAVSNIDCPTLLVRGAQSDLVTMEAVEEFRTLVPHSEFVDVSDAGHMIVGDRNDVFADVIVEFLNRTVKSR